MKKSKSQRVDNPYATSVYAASWGGSAGARRHTMPVPLAPSSGAVIQYNQSQGPKLMVNSSRRGNMRGRVMDAFVSSFASARREKWKSACVRATNHDISPPNGKNVRMIMQGLQLGGYVSDKESPAGSIFHHLQKRMLAEKWMVSVKAQTVFHLIFREDNYKFVHFVATNARSSFRMEFYAAGSTDSILHMPFVKTYGIYLEQWLAMKAAINFPEGKSKDNDPSILARYRGADIEELLAVLPVMLDTMDALISIDLGGPIKFSPVATPAFSMILRDLTLFWRTVSDGIARLLELYNYLDVPIATIALDVYERYVEFFYGAQPFIKLAHSLNVQWESISSGEVSLDLAESMDKRLSSGIKENEKGKKYSDDEVYESEHRLPPGTEHYYLPEPDYYSSEEEEVEPRRLPPLSPAQSPSEASFAESSSEDEPQSLASAKLPKRKQKKFDPLEDLLGIIDGVGGYQRSKRGSSSSASTRLKKVALYHGQKKTEIREPPLEHTAEDRIENVKEIMEHRESSQQPTQPFGVQGTNMQDARVAFSHPAPSSHHQQTQMQPQVHLTPAQQQIVAYQQLQQAQLAAYQAMMSYHSMAMQQSLAAANTGLSQEQMHHSLQQNTEFASQTHTSNAFRPQQQQQQRQYAASEAVETQLPHAQSSQKVREHDENEERTNRHSF